MTQFFRIEEPMYDSDYHTVWVNGHAWTTYGLPGVDCSVCGDTRGGGCQIVPYWLPAELAGDRRLSQRWPIPETEHMALRAEVAEILGEAYAEAAKEQAWPGVVDFPPISWRVPTRPLGDIFWPFYGPIISARLADALRSIGATGYQTIPVEDVLCGPGSTASEPVIPESWDMEELWNQGTEPPPDGMAFFLMDVKSQGKMTPKMTPQPPCPGCGYSDVDRAYGWGRWDDAVWPGDDIFHFPTSRSMVVTKRIVALFEDLKVSNIEVRALKPGDPVSLDFYTKLHDYQRTR